MHHHEKSIEKIMQRVEEEAEEMLDNSKAAIRAIEEIDEMARDLSEMIEEEESSCLKNISRQISGLKHSIKEYFKKGKAKKDS